MYTIMSILVCIIMRDHCMHRILAEKSVNITELRKTQLNTLLINRLRFFLIIAPQDIS